MAGGTMGEDPDSGGEKVAGQSLSKLRSYLVDMGIQAAEQSDADLADIATRTLDAMVKGHNAMVDQMDQMFGNGTNLGEKLDDPRPYGVDNKREGFSVEDHRYQRDARVALHGKGGMNREMRRLMKRKGL